MGGKVNPTVVGAFVVGAVVLVVVGLLLFGGGKFFKGKLTYVMYFDSSVQGLNVGAPVVFRGVQVGQVSKVEALADPKDFTIRIKVLVELLQGTITVEGGPFRDPHQAIEGFVQRGVRASLQLQSFVTGLLFVSLDMRPDTPIKRLGLDKNYPELPTVPSDMDQLMANVKQAVTDLGKLPLESLLNELVAVFKRVNALLDLPELRQALVSLNDITTAAKQLLQDADGQVGPLATKLAGAADAAHSALETARATLGDAQKLVRNVDGQVAPLASSAKDTLAAARGTLGQAQKSLATLTDSAAPTLKQGEKAFASVAGLTGPDSVLLNDLSHTLKALEDTARSLRVLADSLQRNPEVLLRGKSK